MLIYYKNLLYHLGKTKQHVSSKTYSKNYNIKSRTKQAKSKYASEKQNKQPKPNQKTKPGIELTKYQANPQASTKKYQTIEQFRVTMPNQPNVPSEAIQPSKHHNDDFKQTSVADIVWPSLEKEKPESDAFSSRPSSRRNKNKHNIVPSKEETNALKQPYILSKLSSVDADNLHNSSDAEQNKNRSHNAFRGESHTPNTTIDTESKQASPTVKDNIVNVQSSEKSHQLSVSTDSSQLNEYNTTGLPNANCQEKLLQTNLAHNANLGETGQSFDMNSSKLSARGKKSKLANNAVREHKQNIIEQPATDGTQHIEKQINTNFAELTNNQNTCVASQIRKYRHEYEDKNMQIMSESTCIMSPLVSKQRSVENLPKLTKSISTKSLNMPFESNIHNISLLDDALSPSIVSLWAIPDNWSDDSYYENKLVCLQQSDEYNEVASSFFEHFTSSSINIIQVNST